MGYHIIYIKDPIPREPFKHKYHHEVFKDFYVPNEDRIDFSRVFQSLFSNHQDIKRMSCIYAIMDEESNFVYIGTTEHFHKRMKVHMVANSAVGRFLREAFTGGRQLSVKILCDKKCFIKEDEFIRQYKPLANRESICKRKHGS